MTLILAFFMPGIVYLADAARLARRPKPSVVRGLSLGVPMGRMVGRETLTGVAIGLTLALIAGPLVWWHWNNSGLGVSVGVSVFAASSTATVVAMALPWILDTFSLDPAFGSGPLATVTQDLLSIWIYLVVTASVM